MRKSNFALRLLPSLMEELRKAAAEDGVALNQYINIAVAEKLASRRTAAEFFAERARSGDPAEALRILNMAGRADEPEPDGGNDIVLPPRN